MSTEEPAAGPRPLVIGVGNRHRGDDAAGPLVVDAIEAAEGDTVLTATVDGDLTALVLQWHRDQDVVLVDAMRTGRPPGTIVEVDGLTTGSWDRLGLGPSPSSSHGIGVAEAVRLAAILDRLPRTLLVVGVEAASFDLLARPSRPVAEAVEHLARRLPELLAGDRRSERPDRNGRNRDAQPGMTNSG